MLNHEPNTTGPLNELEEHMDERVCRIVADFFAVFANVTRINIFCALRDGRKSVSEIAEYAGVSLQNTSQHLRLMRDKGAVFSEKEGQNVYYQIADPKFIHGVKMIRDALVELLQEQVGSMHLVPSLDMPEPAQDSRTHPDGMDNDTE